MFPPLPKTPAPPQFDLDPRQRRFLKIAAAIVDQLGSSSASFEVQAMSGFPASAVNVGELKSALEGGMKRLDMRAVRVRWSDDVFDWMRLTIRAWVQRCKMMRLVARRNGVNVKLETQDDLGYYRYEFDVFPRKSEKDVV